MTASDGASTGGRDYRPLCPGCLRIEGNVHGLRCDYEPDPHRRLLGAISELTEHVYNLAAEVGRDGVQREGVRLIQTRLSDLGVRIGRLDIRARFGEGAHNAPEAQDGRTL